MSRVSVVIVAYRSGDALPRCLSSIDEDVEVLVVDNGGDVGDLPAVEVLRPGKNVGFAAGCNFGARHAHGDVLVFLNPDTVVAPGAISTLVETLEDGSVGIAMARLRLLAQPELLNSSGNVIHVTGLAWSGGYGRPAIDVAEPREITYPSGAAMAMRADVFRDLGGFRDELFLYHEDLELGWRARMRGYRVVLMPGADVFHDYSYSRNAEKSYYMERNRLVFVLSAFSARLLLVLAPVLLAAELALFARAAREGWLRAKLAGWAWCARNSRGILAMRRETQARRRVSDRELAALLTPSVDPGMVPASRVLRLANPLVARYWSLARRAL
ncbi:MAG: glycosyltransferase family 2 protein [Gaiellaceae bacterium]